jgi:hypothetical protein
MEDKNGALSNYRHFKIELSFLSQDSQLLPKQIQQVLRETAAYRRLVKKSRAYSEKDRLRRP